MASRLFQSSNRSFSTLGAPIHLSNLLPRPELHISPATHCAPTTAIRSSPETTRSESKRSNRRAEEERCLPATTDRGSCASAAEMVVLMEEFHGLSLKRKGAHEPDLFDDAGDRASGFSLSCRATKMRRLACPDGPRDGDMGGAVTAAWEDDVAMGDAAAAASPSPGAVGDGDERAVVVYGDGGSSNSSSCCGRIEAPRLRADWIRAMLREADSRTVRELLAGAALERGSDSDLALAVVPWVAPTSGSAAAAEEIAAEASTADDGTADGEGAAAMDVEEDEGQEGGRPWTWTGHGQTYGEGLVYRWPQHCWAAPAPAAAQASPVMWSW